MYTLKQPMGWTRVVSNCEMVLIVESSQSNTVQEVKGLGNSGPITEMISLSRWSLSGMLLYVIS